MSSGLRKYKTQIVIVAAAALLALLWTFAGQEEFDGRTLLREGYGGTSREYRLMVDGLLGEGEEAEISVSVKPRVYSEEEAREAFEQLAEALPELILGENESLQAVRTKLNLVRSVPETGIRLTWYPEDTGLISYDGQVQNETLREARETAIRAVMTDGSHDGAYVFDVTVLPQLLTGREAVLRSFEKALSEEDEKQAQKMLFSLPEEIAGKPVRYSMKKNRDGLYILILGVLAAVLLFARERTNADKKQKERAAELMIDYSELVSKLTVYLGAGLTIRNAWQRIAGSYQEARRDGTSEKRFLYEEMLTALEDMQKGIPEGSAYRKFAERIRLRPYTRLCALLEQNRKNGGKNLRMLLSAEMEAAFEERKNTAKRLGEEAGTKLLIPLFLMLMIVMVIVVIPAMFSMS
ncbi:MAG: type II secretion system F family protein [Eubacteriales bacterium]|nr:type II secretion system F family protein [Eubacteriales bacterium]